MKEVKFIKIKNAIFNLKKFLFLFIRFTIEEYIIKNNIPISESSSFS